MSIQEREAYVEKMAQQRKEIQKRINKLNEDRRKYVADNLVEGQDNTLDAAMLKIIREQAEEKNYEFE
ncbi:MAG: hypothetical protein IIA49_15235 [Bacteroidetes bacterium]|nr:hypothetical protein [Bacteroidota bacterium]